MARRPKRPEYDARIKIGIHYVRDVVAGRIIVGKWVRLACARFFRDLEEAEAGHSPWIFDERFAIRPIHLAGMLHNVKGPRLASRYA